MWWGSKGAGANSHSVWKHCVKIPGPVGIGASVARPAPWLGLGCKQGCICMCWPALTRSPSRPAGEVRMMVSGASALSPEVFEFMRIVFDCVVIEGYGMTGTRCRWLGGARLRWRGDSMARDGRAGRWVLQLCAEPPPPSCLPWQFLGFKTFTDTPTPS